jgi:hypothetical protein
VIFQRLSLTCKAGYLRKERFWGCRKDAWAGNSRIKAFINRENLPRFVCLSEENQLTKRAEKLLILALVTGFFLFLVFCSCKNENLIDPLDILDPDNPAMWPVSFDCGILTPGSQSSLVPQPGEEEIQIWTGPNPTSGPICIQYVLPAVRNVSLAVYTQKGEKLATIVREQQSAGTYIQRWNLEDDSGIPVADGTYRAYFMAGGFVSHGDIIVQR